MPSLPQDPYSLKALPFLSPRRLFCWVVPNRFWRLYCHFAQKPFSRCLDSKSCKHFMQELGAKLPDTSVTANQRALLLKAVAETESLGTPIAEVGCFNGVTTRALASQTTREIYAIDPYANPKNSEAAYAKFCEATGTMPHVRHLRQSSGDAARTLAGQRLSLVFIDAVHDYLNTWFDFKVWSELVQDGGFMAFHDVDDWRGTNVACQKILNHQKNFSPWGYCPNLVVFRKVKSA